ncbi:MAG: DUF1684 domain-containing protein [Caldilineaceae bacterium]|nr:DUF1684 domain-containing protein [Caldilineaceae bacterium]
MLESAVDHAYAAALEEWRTQRIAELRRPDGWLSLAGLFWLSAGRSSFGSAPDNDIIFPADKAAPVIGDFVLEDGQVRVEIRAGVDVLHDGQPVAHLTLADDKSKSPTILTHRSLSWLVIRRDDQLGIRLRDSESPALTSFDGVPSFPVDPSWRVEAVLERYDPPRSIPVPTILGTLTPMPSPGALVFTVDGEEYRLDAFGAANGALSLIFADATTGKETYGGGRFLSVDAVDEQDRTIIDFNRAYNPPCAFTPYATCPRPPQQNRLSLAIHAGEKSFDH